MSRGGPFSGYQDQAPHGWPDHHQTLWRLPWEGDDEEYMEWRDWREPPLKLRKTQVVSTGVSASGVPDGTRTPGGSPLGPPDEEDPRASQLPYSGAPARSQDRRP